METNTRKNVGGRPRNGDAGNDWRAKQEWGRRKGPIVMMRGEDEFGRQAIIVKDDTPGNERRAPMIVTADRLAQLSFIVAETLQIENPAESWAQMRLAQILAKCSPERVEAAFALLMPTERQSNDVREIFGVLENSREAVGAGQ